MYNTKHYYVYDLEIGNNWGSWNTISIESTEGVLTKSKIIVSNEKSGSFFRE